MKMIKMVACFLCINICIFSISVRAAVVSDNDASGFITKAEFEAYRNNVQKLIDNYNVNLSSAIDGSIATYLATLDTTGLEMQIYDQVWPIGFVLLANQAPSYGTWQEITDTTGRCLWVDSTKTWGTVIAQALPSTTFNVSTQADHTHTFTGTRTQTDTSGAHNHTAENENDGTHLKYVSDTTPMTSTSGGVNRGQNINPNAGTTHSAHTHTFKALGTISAEADHEHTITIGTSGYGAVGSKVQPLAYVIKMWKRIA